MCLDLAYEMLSYLSPTLSHVLSFLMSTFFFWDTLQYYVLTAELGLSVWSEFIFWSDLFQLDGISEAHIERELRWEVLSWAWLVLTEVVAKQKYSKVPPRSASSSMNLLFTHNSLLSSLKLVLQVKCQPALCLQRVPTALSLLQLLGRRVWYRSLRTGLSQLSFVTDLLCVLVQPFNFSKPITSSVCWDNNSNNNSNNNADSVRLLWGLKGFERIS